MPRPLHGVWLAAVGLPAAAGGGGFPVVQLDLFRAMTGASAEGFPTEDNDIADVGGVLKYIHTELLTEHLGDPLRKHRKYNVDSVRKQRFKIRNPDSLLEASSVPDFGQFVTYDWGEATNKAQLPLMEQYGDFVGMQPGCANGQCDPRYPSHTPYNWYSVGNWCPNLPFDKKGSKERPNPLCTRHAGKPLVGGLCTGGADHANAVPAVEPDGSPGCVYTYGRPSLVLLDDLVGITREDCAGNVKCRDWLHFRNNCTNERYRRQFDPITGQIKRTSFCVEYDIHPQCEANCHLPACQSLRAGEQPTELGLPFWLGRCDPRANQRRLETVSASFGLAGALDWHQSVDPASLEPNAQCTREGSNACRPSSGLGGPYCTRALTGACESCFIPGTKEGPKPTQKPYCPLDILRLPDYHDTDSVPPPVCESKRPRDLCCLYTKSCEDVTTLGQPPLDDDGLALVLAEGSTAAVQAFLQRAADQGMISVSMLELNDLRRAAYAQWARYPTGVTLAEVLADVKSFLERPPPELLPAATTVIVTTTPGTNCFEEGVAFYPLDMQGTKMTSAENAWECQDKCAVTKGCAHFSFFFFEGLGGQCHLQDVLAARTPLSTGFTSGPSRCWKDLDSLARAALVVKEDHTYLPKSWDCLELHTAYQPPLTQLDAKAPSLSGMSVGEALKACGDFCASSEGCAHFMVSGQPLACAIAGKDASKVAIEGTASGSDGCGREAEDPPLLLGQFEALGGAAGGRRRSRPVRCAFAALAGGALAALGAAASLLRPLRSAARASPRLGGGAGEGGVLDGLSCGGPAAERDEARLHGDLESHSPLLPAA